MEASSSLKVIIGGTREEQKIIENTSAPPIVCAEKQNVYPLITRATFMVTALYFPSST